MTRKLSFLSPLHLLLYCCPHALNPPLHLPKIPPSIWLDPSTPSCLHRLSILFQVEVKYTPVCLFNKLVGSYFFCSYTTHAPRSSLTPSIFSSFCLTATFAMSSCCSFLSHTLPTQPNLSFFLCHIFPSLHCYVNTFHTFCSVISLPLLSSRYPSTHLHVTTPIQLFREPSHPPFSLFFYAPSLHPPSSPCNSPLLL